ncbi:MAG: cytochrome c oxidase subunit 4 [Actinobacteria bacterium]|nr:cytochrome c oxidase subunit 4 [Actinomycetota bacterium]MCL5445899.1 cytochrome c oxidase subunit 4 [Actinomycetota bacterium]
MKVEGVVLISIGIFMAVVSVGYWFWSGEPSGTAMLIGSVLLGLLPGGYYYWWAKRMRPRPEDRPDATVKEGAGVIGSFPHGSMWPLVFGAGAFLTGLALAFGWWFLPPGAGLIVVATLGVTMQSRRGGTI